MKFIYKFNEKASPKISEVGGKAYSLIKMSQANFPVPDGFVCSQSFFQEWMKVIKKTDEWKNLQKALVADEDIRKYTEKIKKIIKSFKFTKEQVEALNPVLSEFPNQSVYAVRSSSPEEDLSGSSFAGMYKTFLGVTQKKLQQAIIETFCSAFDERVFSYKKQRGFSLKEVKIAVIVMTQIDAETSGVGFSMNPINNDYDESFINANFGLGESIVSGMVTPDVFVINKSDQKIISKQLGDKKESVYLSNGVASGTVKKKNKDTKSFSISDEQALEISQMIVAVENLYDTPMDIEWAYADKKLYMLQARPITTYIPLPPEMLSNPKNKKRTLYYDASVLEGITTNDPITPMTLDWVMQSIGNLMAEPYIGHQNFSADGDVKNDLMFGKGVRMYVNFSQLFFLFKPPKMAGLTTDVDKSFTQTLKNIDLDVYLPEKKFPCLKWRSLIPFGLKALFRSAHLIPMLISSTVKPLKFYKRKYEPVASKTLNYFKQPVDKDILLNTYLSSSGEQLKEYFLITVPLLMAYVKSLAKLNALFEDESENIKLLGAQLTKGVQGDEAVDLGISLYNLSQMLTPEVLANLDELVHRLKKNDLPKEFLKKWEEFIQKYGSRAPNEMEIANIRYRDDPKMVFEQMSYMQHASQDPAILLKEHIKEKEKAYQALQKKLPKNKLKQLKKHFEITEKLSAARNTLKYVIILQLGEIRKIVLRDAKHFVRKGRLEDSQDIFFLTFDEIQKAHEDSTFDIKSLVPKRKSFYQTAKNNTNSFPALIDSRGRIPGIDLKDATQISDNPSILHGNGISRGVAKGRIKILKDPREKRIEKGDVLVTYTTDPGWTPLFIGAEAIILEIGGMLQHGGVVAREFGKPCVAGIHGITKKLKDGQLVEVDGTKGIIKILE